MTEGRQLRGKDIGVIIGRTMGYAGFFRASGMWVPNQMMDSVDIERGIGDAPSVSIPYSFIDNVCVDGNVIWRNKDVYDIGELGKSISQDYYGRGEVILAVREMGEPADKLLSGDLLREVGFELS